MLVFAREIHHLRHFGLSDLVRENATFADSMLMYVQHDSRGLLSRFAEEPLDDMNHEFHRGVVVVQQQHSVEVGTFRLRLDPRNDAGYRAAIVAAAGAIVIPHPHASEICTVRAHW
jgi:hypothetical protein